MHRPPTWQACRRAPHTSPIPMAALLLSAGTTAEAHSAGNREELLSTTGFPLLLRPSTARGNQYLRRSKYIANFKYIFFGNKKH